MSIFTTVPMQKVRYNSFRLDNENTLTCDAGQLIPVFCRRLFPGDKIRMNSTAFVEFLPMLAPVRSDIDVTIHHFFVPYRLIWDDFEDWITGGKDGTARPDPPKFNLAARWKDKTAVPGSLYDYLNYPTNNDNTTYSTIQSYFVSSLKLRAYQQIFNDYYIDLNLTDEVDFSRGSGNETTVTLPKIDKIRYRAWRKDYFTSALPFTQRGQAVQVQTADTLVKLKSLTPYTMFKHADGTLVRDSDIKTDHDGNITDNDGSAIFFDPNGTLGLDGGLFTIEDLRHYTAVQRFLEVNARGGSRYMENILSHFNVLGKDARLQRAEYLGGGKTPVIVGSIKQTSSSQDGTNALGEMAGTAASAGGNNAFTYRATEHGIIMSIMSITPRATYFQGIDREDLFDDKTEWFWPEFQHLGEQDIKNCELYFDPVANADTNNATFGYSPRYAEYKFSKNEVHGQMRSTLMYWHLARNFGNLPTLSDEFVRVKPGQVARIFANMGTDLTDNHMVVTVGNYVKMLRPMLKNPIPKLL